MGDAGAQSGATTPADPALPAAVLPTTLPTGRVFHRQFSLFMTAVGVAGAGVILLYLVALLQLPAHQLTGLWWILGGVVAVVSPGLNWIQYRATRPLTRCLDDLAAGRPDHEGVRRAFACAIDMPRRIFVLQIANFAVSAGAVVVLMASLYADFSARAAITMLLAAVSGGLVSTLVQCFMLKRRLEGIRNELARRLPDPAERAGLVRAFPLGRKLGFVLMTVALVPVVFAVLLAESRGSDAARRLEGGILETAALRAADTVEREGPEALVAVEREATAWGIPVSLVRVELDAPTTASPAIPSEALAILSRQAATGAPGGGSDRGAILRWHRVADSPVAIVALDARPDAGSLAAWGVFSALLLGSGATALLLAWMVSEDVGRAASALRTQTERVAAGDLSSLAAMESEDELGDLARTFARMAGALRATVGRVAEAARHVDAHATSVGEVANEVTSATADQVAGMRDCRGAMERVREGVLGIESSAGDLQSLAEQSASATLQLGASSEQLNDTSGILFSKVDEVSSSIEQMVRSQRQVGENTDTLAAAAIDTSSSMEEMSKSMQHVDEIAEEAAALSLRVVAEARTGRDRVRDTITGMEAIREATERAEGVIRGLGSRAEEMAAILDVIDTVADETNLLALNAAIISAQAGESGRAFAVVAGEIKSLADRVLSSTKEIGGLIAAVQAESGAAVEAIAEGSRSVAAGRDLSIEAGRALEQINGAASDSRDRIQEIARAVQEQAKASGHVAGLMVRVTDGLGSIRSASQEQGRGNEVVFRSTQAMREVAEQLRHTTEEQTRSTRGIRDVAEQVRAAVEAIRNELRAQGEAGTLAAGHLEQMSERAGRHEAAADRLADATRALDHQADALRADVDRFAL